MKKNVLITGAVKGIGLAISELMVKENYFVLLVDKDESTGIELELKLGAQNSKFFKCDVSSEKQVVQLFLHLKNGFPNIDVVVNNAGIVKDSMIWNMTLQDFNSIMDVNLKGTWLVCREAAKIMKKQNSGRIINVASRAWLGNIGQSNYAPSKGGVISLTRVLALELGKYNVFVNAVAPGLIDTPLTQSLKSHVMERLIEAQPTKTIGRASDVAHVVAFLANEKTRFITGQTIYIDGGKSIGASVP